ncbi:MAG: DCC1-like thiol-disulfide oxidoreductase family protein [Planctomycetota bacterium]
MTETSPVHCARPLLAYDGDCRMCIRGVHFLEVMGLLDDEIDQQPAQLITGQDRKLLDHHRRSGEIVLLDVQRQDVRTGAAAFRWLIQRKLPPSVGRMLDLAPIYLLLVIGYRTIASWRRIISPPSQSPDPTFAEPDWVDHFRLAGSLLFIGLLYGWIPLVLGPPDLSQPATDSLPRAEFLTDLALWIGAFSLVGPLLVSEPRRRIDTLAVLAVAIFVATIALSTLVLIENYWQGNQQLWLSPWLRLCAATICGWSIIFRSRRWLASDRPERSSRFPVSWLRISAVRISILTSITLLWQIWIGFLYDWH